MASFLPGRVISEPGVDWGSNMGIKIGKGVTLTLSWARGFGYPGSPAGGDPWEPPDPNSQRVSSWVGFKVPGMGGGPVWGLGTSHPLFPASETQAL